MKNVVGLVFLLLSTAVATGTESSPSFDEKAAERFAKLALVCVVKVYPNKICNLLNSDADVAPPRRAARTSCISHPASTLRRIKQARIFPINRDRSTGFVSKSAQPTAMLLSRSVASA